MRAQGRWPIWSAPSIVAGLIWSLEAAAVGWLAAVPLWWVALMHWAAGGGTLFAPGDRRLTQVGALAGVVGLGVALPAALALGPSTGLLLASSTLFAGWGAGRLALELEPGVPGLPAPTATPVLAAQVAADELILGLEQILGTTGYRLDGTIERVVREVDATHALFDRRGWLEKPALYHAEPPLLEDLEISRSRVRGRSIEVLRFESGYAPPEGSPGRERWLSHEPCREGWAYVLRHEGPPRPWLIATNGYRTGHAIIDVSLFERFHEENGGLGLNVLIPVLPLHGPRRTGIQSGTGFLSIDVVQTIHAESQALWDMRRLLGWVQRQGATAVGAFGLSLGGMTTANFASLAEGLVSAIPGIPLTDIRRTLERHGAGPQLEYAKRVGLDLKRADQILRVISPLALEPRVSSSARLIFGATADRLVPPDQVLDLWRHWEEPEIVWYDGSHLSFVREPAVWDAVDRMFRAHGLHA